MTVVYIHGASASSASFNYLRSQLSESNEHAIDYSSRVPFFVNLQRIVHEIKHFNEIFFIGHSLGGIYALHLANLLPQQTVGAVTLSTPYGGSREADIIQFVDPFTALWRDVGPWSCPIQQALAIKPPCPWLNVVSTRGSSPLILGPNDGVVTVASQMAHPKIKTTIVETTHYEVTQCKESVTIASDALRRIHDKTYRFCT